MAEFTEKQVFDALEIEPETPAEGGKEQAAAEPVTEGAASTEDQGEKEQGPAAPATEENAPGTQAGQCQGAAPGTEPDGKEEPGDREPDGGKPAMTDEERREAAAKRRRQEQRSAIDEAVNKALQAEREKNQGELEAFFKSAQLKNTFTNQPITSMQEFREWRQAYDAAQLQRDLKAGKLTPEALSKAISEVPAMRKVQELIDRGEKAERKQREVAAQQQIAAELAEIQKLDPTVQSLQDLLKMPTAKEFYAYVTKNHLSYLDAFRLANRERLEQQTTEAARRQAMTNARGKDHMTSTKPQGAGAIAVPDDEAVMYKLLNPEATDAEIQAHFNRYKKQ